MMRTQPPGFRWLVGGFALLAAVAFVWKYFSEDDRASLIFAAVCVIAAGYWLIFDRDATPSNDQTASDEPVSDEQVSDEQVSDGQVSDGQVSDGQVSDEPVSHGPSDGRAEHPERYVEDEQGRTNG